MSWADRTWHLARGGGAAIATVLMLAGCSAVLVLTPVASDPQPKPTVSEAPTEEISEPTPFIDMSCNELITEASLFSALGVVVALAPRFDDELASWARPTQFALASNRGITCNWSNGQPFTIDDSAVNPDYVAVWLWLLPEAADDLGANEVDEGLNCTDNEGKLNLYCSALALSGTTLIEMSSFGGPSTGTQDQAALWESVQARVAEAEPVEEKYIAPTPLPLTFSCNQFMTEESARAALGLTNGVFFDGGNLDGGSPLEFLSRGTAKSDDCIWVVPDGASPSSDPVGIANAYLEGGEWAFQSLLASNPERYEKVAIEGISAPDAAYLDCREASDGCTVNLIIGHNWITFGVVDASRPGAVPGDRRVLLRLGELTAATLRG